MQQAVHQCCFCRNFVPFQSRSEAAGLYAPLQRNATLVATPCRHHVLEGAPSIECELVQRKEFGEQNITTVQFQLHNSDRVEGISRTTEIGNPFKRQRCCPESLIYFINHVMMVLPVCAVEVMENQSHLGLLHVLSASLNPPCHCQSCCSKHIKSCRQ